MSPYPTASCIGGDVIIITADCIGQPGACCPCIRTACTLCCSGMTSVGDCKLQCHCILTASCIGGDVIIITTYCIGQPGACCPCIRTACTLCCSGMTSVGDR